MGWNKWWHTCKISYDYWKTSRSLYQFCRDEPNNTVNSESPKFKPKSLNNINNEGIIDAKITMPLKHLSNFCITLEMPLINCAINLF